VFLLYVLVLCRAGCYVVSRGLCVVSCGSFPIFLYYVVMVRVTVSLHVYFF
jgi:hypothetical protein